MHVRAKPMKCEYAREEEWERDLPAKAGVTPSNKYVFEPPRGGTP